MKKIAIVTSLSGVGGTEKSLLNLLKSLPENAFNLDLVLLGDDGPLVEEIPSWINIKHIKSLNGKNYIISELKRFNLIKALYGIIRLVLLKLLFSLQKRNSMLQYKLALFSYSKCSDDYDIAITWNLPNSYHTVYTLEKVNAKQKWIWIHMDVRFDKPPFDAEKYFNRYDKIMCVSNECKKGFDRTFPLCKDKTGVFYNVLDVAGIIEKGAIDNEISQSDKFVIVTCGRISSEKRPQFAIEIAKKLIDSGVNNFVWYFVGDGLKRAEMETAIKFGGGIPIR